MTGSLIGVITLAHPVGAVRLVASIISTAPFTSNANVPLAAGAARSGLQPDRVRALVLGPRSRRCGGPRPWNVGRARLPVSGDDQPGLRPAEWYPKFVDYLHLSFSTATAFSPTDVSPIKPWAKLMMLVEDAISLVVAAARRRPRGEHPEVATAGRGRTGCPVVGAGARRPVRLPLRIGRGAAGPADPIDGGVDVVHPPHRYAGATSSPPAIPVIATTSSTLHPSSHPAALNRQPSTAP